MPIQGGMSMSMVMMEDMEILEEMLDMEEALDSAVDQYEEFGRGRMGGDAKSSKKSSKKSGASRKASAPTPGVKKSSKRR